MIEIFQKTLCEPISFEGIGLHSGKNSKITILPAKENQGIIFKRIDLNEKNIIPANYENVSSAKLCTTLENKFGVRVSTVEHLLAALYMAEVDNATVEINNEEVPIMDGSAQEFLNVLKFTEIKTQNKKRKYLKIINKVELIDGERKISIEPSESLFFQVDFQLNYKNKIIGKQENTINFQSDDLKEVSESRTFCLFEDIEKIKKAGLARGGSLDNALVIDKDRVINDGGLRNKKEFVNHKILDLAGDFLLSGYRVLGKVRCHQGGHELTNTFLRKLLVAENAFSSVELNDFLITEKTNSKESIKLAVNA
jgi:UDP-3-O-[3-hydroxymyristoyl] N-acetylglucosamine deacetylase